MPGVVENDGDPMVRAMVNTVVICVVKLLVAKVVRGQLMVNLWLMLI